jgi:ADP-heptose:LPS heptosyltransferase
MDAALELPIHLNEWTAWDALAIRHALALGTFVCIHPGARLPSRRWPMARFTEVARRIGREGWTIVLTGTPEERPLVETVAGRLQRCGLKPINLCGQTSIGTLAAMLSECRLLICNDTGISHVAAAVGTASVVIACGSDSRRWAPLDSARHRVIAHDVECRPCAYLHCPVGHPCALGVTVDMVVREARQLLDRSQARAWQHAG